MTWRLMCDSDEPDALVPTDVAATYADLFTHHHQAEGLQARLPRTQLVFIDRALGDPLGLATVADYESHAVGGHDLRAKLERWHTEHRQFVTVYHDEADTEKVMELVGGVSFYQWVAWYGHLITTPKRHAVQQFVSNTTLDLHLDLSVIHDPGWHPDPHRGEWLHNAHHGLRQVIADLSDVAAVLNRHRVI